MSLAYLGGFTLGQVIPIALDANAALLAELQARLTGILEMQARLTVTPPTLAASLDAALALVANLEATIALGLPSASLDLSVVAAVVAALEATVALALSIEATLGTAGVHAWRWSGPASGIVGSIPGGSPSDHTDGLVLLAATPAAWAAMQVAFTT